MIDHTERKVASALRGAVLILVSLLGVAGAWILVAETIRPAGLHAPKSAGESTVLPSLRNAAELSASLGVARGDLWIDFALTYFDHVFRLPNAAARISTTLEPDRGRTAAQRALRLSPLASPIWLLLAALDRERHFERESDAAIRMSYYTDPNSIELALPRLSLSLNSRELINADFQGLVSHDIRLIVNHSGDVLPGLIASYNSGSAKRTFLIDEVGKYNPQLAIKLRRINTPTRSP